VMIGSEQALLHSQHQEQPLKSGEALDVAARYLLYKLYDTQRASMDWLGRLLLVVPVITRASSG
jgi:hypothetical protein